MGLGLQTRWIGDCNPNEPRIEMQMDQMTLGLQPKWVQNCNLSGSRAATRWVWDCNRSEFWIAARGSWDWKLNEPRIAKQMDLELQNPEWSSVATQMGSGL